MVAKVTGAERRKNAAKSKNQCRSTTKARMALRMQIGLWGLNGKEARINDLSGSTQETC